MRIFSFLRFKDVFANVECVLFNKIRGLFHARNTLKSIVKICMLLEAIIYKKVRFISMMMLSDAIKLLLQVYD